MAADRATPLTAGAAAALFERLGPFEREPIVAAAVSGGSDSMALALLADDWARSIGGRVVALTVDHGLRPDSAAEARRVAVWLAARGIDHHTLVWTEGAGMAGGANLQARARQARYALLARWSRAHGVLHLMLGHHRDDQAETLLIRLGRGSGADGLAGMAPVAETADLRLLRPFLGLRQARLAATLRARGQDWIEDPSNLDRRYARVRVRQALPGLAELGLSAGRLAGTAARLGRARAALDRATAAALAAAVTMSEAGYAFVDAGHILAPPREIGLRALARVLTTVGGGVYGPRLERLERLYEALAAGRLGRGRTLAGCRVMPAAKSHGAKSHGAGRLLICREAAAAAGPEDLEADGAALWDGRFHVAGGGPGLVVGKLGAAGLAEIPAKARVLAPAAARAALPAIRDPSGLLAVPHLDFVRPGADAGRLPEVRFSPTRPLAGPAFV